MKSILWIEDDALALQELMRPIVHSGIELKIVETYTDALEELEGGKAFDAFVVDLILPLGRDEKSEVLTETQDTYLGISLVKEIKTQRPEAPVFVLTVVSNDAVSRTLTDLGITRILRKPILPSELRDVVLEAITKE